MRTRAWIMHAFTALLSVFAASLCATQATAQPLIGLCVDERGNPCARDERPAVGGAEARRNFLRSRDTAAREQLSDAHIIDLRNGQFLVAVQPYWRAGYCTSFIEEFPEPRRYVHLSTSEHACDEERTRFDNDSMHVPLLGSPERLQCDQPDASRCFAARQRIMDAAASAEDTDRVSFPTARRGERSNATRLRWIANSQHLIVRISPDYFGWSEQCARFSDGWRASAVSAVICQNDGRSTVYLDGPYIE